MTGGVVFIQPPLVQRIYWVKTAAAVPSASLSPHSPHRAVHGEVVHLSQGRAPPCTRRFSQPSVSAPPGPVRQVSAPAFVKYAPHPFPSTPRLDFREPQRAPVKVVADSPRNTIVSPALPGAAQPENRVPVKIRVVASQIRQKEACHKEAPCQENRPSGSGVGVGAPVDPLSVAAPLRKGLGLRKERAGQKRQEPKEEAEEKEKRPRAEADRRHLRQRSADLQRRHTQRESLAEDLRRLAEEKRRARQVEAEEVERKRAEAQRSRQEAAFRRLQGKLLMVEEKHRLAEEARRVSEEGRRRRFSETGKSSPRQGRRSEVDARRRAILLRGLAHGRAKSADAAQEVEAERRKAEQERQRLEQEEAERRRIRREQLERRAEESKHRIDGAGSAWHEVLGISATASLQEAKQAFRELALLHHPDKGFENSDDTFRVVRAAYQRALAFLQERDKAGSPAAS
ncbi:unnamed protein product [Effrenium voratum]|nr:unnamed protein product [Effrenium voratum]